MSEITQTNGKQVTSVDFKAVTARYAADMERVEKDIHRHFASDVAMIPAVSGYLISGGGKRIRPLLLIASSRLCGYTGATRHITMSVVAEYIHAATLLHDDVVDEADLRRGAASANAKYGNEASVLVGDFLFAKSFELMSEDGDVRVIRVISGATKCLAEGEVLQLYNTCNVEVSEEAYMDTIYRKTGALIEACCRSGSILGGASSEKEQALALYGKNIGTAFQLVDDVLDYIGEAKSWGKPIGADLADGKVTLPLITTLKQCTEAERETIAGAIEGDDDVKEKLARVMPILEKYNALSHTMDTAREHADEAKNALASAFEPSEHLEALSSIADYIVSRSV